jgi:hypothetical protein
MANYYLKNAGVTKMYRLNYTQSGSNYTLYDAFASATGAAATLPDGTVVSRPDQPVEVAAVLIDQILGALSQGTVAEYRTLSKAIIDASW